MNSRKPTGLVAGSILILLGAGACGSDNDSGSSADEVRTSSACNTLRQYAGRGIPATYIEDGTALLDTLAANFSAMGRNDIAGAIEEIIRLTYQGVMGQVNAKNELISAAQTYC